MIKVNIRWFDEYLEEFKATEVRFGSDLLWMRLKDGDNRHVPLRQVRWFSVSEKSHFTDPTNAKAKANNDLCKCRQIRESRPGDNNQEEIEYLEHITNRFDDINDKDTKLYIDTLSNMYLAAPEHIKNIFVDRLMDNL